LPLEALHPARSVATTNMEGSQVPITDPRYPIQACHTVASPLAPVAKAHVDPGRTHEEDRTLFSSPKAYAPPPSLACVLLSRGTSR
jgi:hypothetical protein